MRIKATQKGGKCKMLPVTRFLDMHQSDLPTFSAQVKGLRRKEPVLLIK